MFKCIQSLNKILRINNNHFWVIFSGPSAVVVDDTDCIIYFHLTTPVDQISIGRIRAGYTLKLDCVSGSFTRSSIQIQCIGDCVISNFIVGVWRVCTHYRMNVLPTMCLYVPFIKVFLHSSNAKCQNRNKVLQFRMSIAESHSELHRVEYQHCVTYILQIVIIQKRTRHGVV